MRVNLKNYLVNSRKFFSNYKNLLSDVQRKYSQNSSELDATGCTMPMPQNPQLLSKFDVVIIGAGAIGSSAAFWLKQKAGSAISVLVIDKDLTYKQASTVLSNGGIRQQFSLQKNVELSIFGADFVQNINHYLFTTEEDAVDIQFRPFGYLMLANETNCEILKTNHKNQLCWGCHNILLTACELKEKFPWLNTEGIKLGCLGQKNEGWCDPWTLLTAVKNQAKKLGACFLEATPQEFTTCDVNSESPDNFSKDRKRLNQVVIKKSDGKIEKIQFRTCVIATGAGTGKLAKELLNLDRKNNGLFHFEIPIEPRKRYIYCFETSDGLGTGSPVVIDPSGFFVRREGLSNNYTCGCCPMEEEEPSIENLDVDYDFFSEQVWPRVAYRIPKLEAIKLKSAWAGFYDYNKLDQNGIVGFHPAYHNLLIAAGFSGHGLMHSPGVGRAVSELLIDGSFQTIDLTCLSFDRVIENEPLLELTMI